MEVLLSNTTKPMPDSQTTWSSELEFRLTNRLLNVLPIDITNYIVCSVGIFGNFVSIFVLMSSPHLRRKPVNVFMTHQALIDLLACIITITEEIMNTYGEKFVKPFLCHIFLSKSGSMLFLYTSTYNLLALTIERHFAIVNPLNYYPDVVLKRLPFVFLIIWILTIVGTTYVPLTTVVMSDKCLIGYKVFLSVSLIQFCTRSTSYCLVANPTIQYILLYIGCLICNILMQVNTLVHI